MGYCTMFAFEGVDDPNVMHCTHKFFSDEYTGSARRIIAELQAHFSQNPFEPFNAKFNRIEHLGADMSYRVAMPESPEPFLLSLKAKLDALHPDAFPEYLPHVTVSRNLDEVDKPIRDYVLMQDGKVIWSAMETQHLLEKQTRAQLSGKEGQSMKDLDKGLEASLEDPHPQPEPKAKTPAEMKQDPAAAVSEDVDQDLVKEMGPEDPSGKGGHDSSINDNDSNNGPA